MRRITNHEPPIDEHETAIKNEEQRCSATSEHESAPNAKKRSDPKRKASPGSHEIEQEGLMRGSISSQSNERTKATLLPRGGAAGRRLSAAQGGCVLCGSTAVDIDEVGAPARLALHECRRCDHRWTRKLMPPQPKIAARRARRSLPAEVAIAS